MKKTLFFILLIITATVLIACQSGHPTLQGPSTPSTQPTTATHPTTRPTTIPTVSNCEHTAVEDKAVASTCTEEGLTQGFHCEKCGYVIIPQRTIEKIPHTIVTDKAVAPTCTSQGSTEGSHCSACKTVFVAQQPVSATGHTPVNDQAVEPTCAAEGLTEGSHCSKCKTVLVAQNAIDKLPHQYETRIFTATCGEDGYTLHKCKCGDSYKDNIISKSYQHSFPKSIENPNAQWHNDDTCSVCGLHVIQHGPWIGENLVRPGTYYYVTDTEIVCYGYGKIPDFNPGSAGIDQPQPPAIMMFDEANTNIRTLIIAPGITYIGSWAFGMKGDDHYLGSQIRTVYIADTVTYIGPGAFNKFGNVKNLYKSKNLTYEGSSNFNK